MKGVGNSPADREGMTNKPIVSCAGDWNLFCTLEAPLVAAIPQDSCEWRRSYGRITKFVYLEATFTKYNKDKAHLELNLLKRPIFNIYWTDCVDVEYYKTTLREDIEIWLKQLEKNNITDWMIVLVETYDIRKTNKLLPRTTVLDKIKSDFAAKQTEDRFISVINPIKSEARSAESWRALVAKVRHFILVAYNKALIKFEEHMREQREKRNDPEWDFCKYFILQEQLAFVLEMLGLYEEALVQYDELDALFSQFVLNSNIAESPKWLETFKQPITSWQAVRLTALVPQNLRESIMKKKASLLDFRSYLFQRQSAMLLLTFKPWEIASRCLTTVHNTLVELSLLNAHAVEGAAACWAHLACAETLRACERLSSTNSAQEACTSMNAPLLHNAKDKLHELGKLCGLLPGSPEPSSEQLHLVVMLSAGMGDSEPNNQQSPTDRLKEALCSKKSFQQYYLELAELAMGTYKHIGRLRFARTIGRDLAAFYSELGETSKAVVFLMDALRSYEEQGWKDLAAQTRLELIAAAKKMNDIDRYTKLSARIASTAELEILVRNFYFEEMLNSIRDNLADKQESVLTELSDCFRLVSSNLLPSERDEYITDNKVQCRLVIESFMPKDLLCTRAAISVETDQDKHAEKRTPVKNYKTDLTVSVGTQANSPKKSVETTESESNSLITSIRLDDLKPKNPLLNPMNISSKLHYKEDKTLQKATVECQNPKLPLRRSDSTKYRKPSATVRNNYETCFKSEDIIIKPGVNDIMVEYTAKKCGTFKLGQVSLLIEGKLEFLSNALIASKMGYEVKTQGVSVYLNKVEPKKDLVAGLEHDMELVVTSGSSRIEEDATILLRTSTGLNIRFAEDQCAMTRELSIPIQAIEPFQTIKIPLRLFANLQPRREKSIEHTVWLTCPWWETITEVPLHFSAPMIASWRLLTSNTRKFIHVTLKSLVAHFIQFILTEPKLDCDGNNKVSDLNPKNSGDMIVASDSTTASFMWELLKDPLVKAGPMKATFTVQYRIVNEEISRTFSCPFDIQDYTTLFVIRTKLEPGKGADFCRASQVCCLQLNVQRVNETEHTSLMYEVLADQTMWAVLGRTAGVITMETSTAEGQCVSLDVMPLGAGYLPLPAVRLSKYIARDTSARDTSAHPRLEPFSPGQVYHAGKAKQVHVLAPAPKEHFDITV